MSTFKVGDTVMHTGHVHPVEISEVLPDDYYEIKHKNVYGATSWRSVHVSTLSETHFMRAARLESEMDALEELDAAQKPVVNTFYQFTNFLDLHIKLRGQTQGRPASEILVLDTIAAECLKRIAALKEESEK